MLDLDLCFSAGFEHDPRLREDVREVLALVNRIDDLELEVAVGAVQRGKLGAGDLGLPDLVRTRVVRTVLGGMPRGRDALFLGLGLCLLGVLEMFLSSLRVCLDKGEISLRLGACLRKWELPCRNPFVEAALQSL